MIAIQEAKGSLRRVGFLALLALGPACSSAGDGEGELSAPPEETSGIDEHPEPIASLELENGNTVEFFDFRTRALLVESGVAGSKPMLKGEPRTDQLITIWNELSYDPPPAALVLLQERLLKQNEEPPPATNAEPSFGGEEYVEPPLPELEPGVLAAPQGCNNDCCDPNYLGAFLECQVPYSYSWYLFNYGWSWYNSGGDIKHYKGFVCAAQGTSTYRVAIGSAGGTWSVHQGTWRRFWWDAYCPWWGCYDYPATTSVNTSSAPALHTYCGGFGF